MPRKFVHRACVGLVVPLVAALGATLTAATPSDGHVQGRGADDLPRVLARAVDGTEVFDHLQKFQQFAHRGDGSRAVGSKGLEVSERYVVRRLTAVGYNVRRQHVPYTKFQVDSEITRIGGAAGRSLETLLMNFSPGLEEMPVTAPLAVPRGGRRGGDDETVGCQASDYADGDYEGTVVLLERASCGYTKQLRLAGDAGALAVLLYMDTPSPGNIYRLHNWATGDGGRIPLASLSERQAKRLLVRSRHHTVRLYLDWRGHQLSGVTENIIAETKAGRNDGVIMAGAHLDSVSEGPGINDNGSSAAALLEIALQLAPRQHEIDNMVRFVWWGAEELVVVGSTYYVKHLSKRQLRSISVYLNFELIASPNGARFILAGDDVVTSPFTRYSARQGIPYELRDIHTLGSDHEPFLAAGVPVGGVYGGSMGVKTEKQARIFGGTAGEMYDPCYHQPCDTTRNIDRGALEQNATMMAWAIGSLAHNAGQP